MKRRKPPGTSTRHGRAPAPYTKYRKMPYKYDMARLKRDFPSKPVRTRMPIDELPNYGWINRRQGNA